MKPWEQNYSNQQEQTTVDNKKPWEKDWANERPDLSRAKPNQIFSVDGSNTNAPSKLSLMNDDVKNAIAENKTIQDTVIFGDSISKSVVRGLYETGKGIGTLVGWYGDNMILPDNFMGLDKKTIDRLNTFGRGWQKAGELLKKGSDFVLNDEGLKLDEKTFSGDIVDNPSVTRVASAVASAAPSLMSMAGLARLTGSTALAYFIMGGVDSADIYEASKEAGHDLETSNGLYVAAMSGTALIDRFLMPVERILGAKITGKSIYSKIAQSINSGFLEASGEGSQTLWQNFVKKYGIDDSQSLLEGVVESAIGGFGSGTFATGAFERANKRLLEKGATQEEINANIDAMGQFVSQNADLLSDISFQHFEKSIADFEKFIEENAGTIEAQKAVQTQKELKQIGVDIKERLVKAGRTEAVADAESKLWQGISLWGAEETGMSPLEYINARMPEIKQAKLNDFVEKYSKVKDNTYANNINTFEALLNPDLLKGVKNADKGESLLQFLRKEGGLKDVGGGLKAMDAGKQYIGLINNKGGNSLDDMALSAWEHGYFPNKTERPSVNDLLEAIRGELFGNKVYAYQNSNNRTLRDDVDDLAEQLERLGIDYRNMSAKEVEKAFDEEVAKYSENNGDTYEAHAENSVDDDFDIPFQFQESASNVIDLTRRFAKISKSDPKKVALTVEKHLNDLIGKAIDTATKPLQVQVTKDNKGHIATSNVELKGGQAKRHNSALMELESIVNNAEKIEKDGTVDLSHNKRKETIRHKKKVEQYVYFEAPIKIGDEEYTVTFTTEQLKGQDPNLLDLYNVQVKRSSPAASSVKNTSALQSGASLNNIALNSENVKFIQNLYQGKLGKPANAAYADHIVWLFEGANESSFMHETAHWFRDELKSFNSPRANAMLEKVDAWERSEFDRRYKTDIYKGRYVVRNIKGNIVYNQNFSTAEQAREYGQNELFARGFEQYLKEGKAPNNYLKQAFRSFWNWLRHLYRTAKSLNVELNDSIRGVYGDIIGGEDLDFYLNEPADNVLKRRIEMSKETRQRAEAELQRAVSRHKNKAWYRELWDERSDGANGLRDFWKAAIVPISTRAQRISPQLRNRLREYDFELGIRYNENVKALQPMLEKWQAMSQNDSVAFDMALKNGLTEKRDEILKKYDALEEFQAVNDLLNRLYDQAQKVGIEMGYRSDYFPRQVEDSVGLLTAIYGEQAATEFERAKKKAGFNDMTPDEQDAWTNKYIRGYSRVDLNKSLSANTKERQLDVVTADLNIYYKNSLSALLNYVDRMNNAIASREFFGFETESPEESIGAFINEMINEGELKATDIKEAEAILKARFRARGVHNKGLQLAKNLSYVYTMGGINSAITQIDDISSALYKAGFKNTIAAAFGKNIEGLTREDLGVAKIAQEFEDASRSSKIVNKLFQMTGLDKIDAFGKNVLINATFKKFQSMDAATLHKRIEPILQGETNKTIEDIENGVISDNVKLLMFNELSDMQPITLSEMPEYYLTSGNGRILYMLKTFTLKRLDIFRNECFDKIRSGDKVLKKEGWQNLFRVSMFMLLCGMGKDWIIDFLYGRDVDLSETFINNMLGLAGLSKYQLYKARDEGFSGLAATFIPPVFAAETDLVKDMHKSLFTDKGKDLSDFEIWKGIPLLGRFYYWHLGGGKTKMEKKKQKKLK